MISVARSVRRARGAATSGSCVVNVLRVQASFRHCQRWRRSFTVTGAPCAGRSCRWRSCQPNRRFERFPQSGQTPDPMAAAEISHWPPNCWASKIRMPCPRNQIDFLSTRPSYGLSPSRSRAQQEVTKNPFNGFFGANSDILTPTRLPTKVPLTKVVRTVILSHKVITNGRARARVAICREFIWGDARAA